MKKLCDYTKKPLAEASELELFNALLNLVSDEVKDRGYNEGKKKVYYVSAEFLIGKLLSNNLINLGIYGEIKEELEAAGKSLAELEEFEHEPSLGNGGLGRLAACFIDSMATLGLPADGVGLAYHCGLFKQNFVNGRQYETPDYWLTWGTESWMRRTDKHYDIEVGGYKLRSTMYEIDVTGYRSKCGRLRLFDIDTIDERLIKNRIQFDKSNLLKNLTLFLYPDDSDEAGRLLRVYQEYFMSANAAQLILEEAEAKGSNLHDLYDYAAVQINDTHPTFVIPELIRLLSERGIAEEEAYGIVTKVCAYTNHTILAEALEKWPRYYLEKAVPHMLPIIDRMNAYIAAKYSDPFVQIIDGDNKIHMANIDIHFSHMVNGVARLHTEILKVSELKPFYDIYPEKFHNKTNGITFRRWLRASNHELSDIISARIGKEWIKDADELEKLLPYADDEQFINELLAVKHGKKVAFAEYVKRHQGIDVNPDSVFDVQSKRLHEYKRQQLNLLWAIDLYREIKAGHRPLRPVTLFFGAKAAPAYVTAKDIIHAIITFGSVVRSDSEVSPWLNVVMLENYNVSMAEKLIPAADISEQISLASKEASGTGNMKFMLNGAVTLGTMDGANVEICELVGNDNIFTFGKSSDEVIRAYAEHSYNAYHYYASNPRLHAAVDFLVGHEMLSCGDEGVLRRLHNELIGKDWFMTFPDFEDYREKKTAALAAYEDRKSWAKKMTVNIAKAGYFSSDRTIKQYNDDVWCV